jgi:hypothetical protein
MNDPALLIINLSDILLCLMFLIFLAVIIIVLGIVNDIKNWFKKRKQ